MCAAHVCNLFNRFVEIFFSRYVFPFQVYDGILLSHTSSSPSTTPNPSTAAKPIAFMVGDDQEHG